MLASDFEVLYAWFKVCGGLGVGEVILGSWGLKRGIWC